MYTQKSKEVKQIPWIRRAHIPIRWKEAKLVWCVAHISISKTFQKSQNLFNGMTLNVSLGVCNGQTNMILCCWLFPSGSFSNDWNERMVAVGADPSLSSVFMLLTEVWLCLIYYRGNASAPATHTSSVHLTLIHWNSKTGKKKFGRNPNALATCCAIEYVFRCGWCVNSLQLQIQVIFNTSSFPNWNLFRNAAYFSSTPRLHCLPNDY